MLDEMTNIDDSIRNALENLAGGTPSEKPSTRKEYIKAFQASARDKADAVANALDQAAEPFRTRHPIFVSIGGGDGEELFRLLERSGAKLGVLIEKVKEFADAARERARSLAGSKRVEVFEGDAQDKVPDAMAYAKSRLGQEGDFLAVTCHAVIHELYDRSEKEFDLVGFLGGIFRFDVPIWFTSREPGVPEKWPEKVLMEARCQPNSLLLLAKAIASRHPELAELDPQPQIVGDGLYLHKTLAMEVLAKLFYLDGLAHEINERSTSVDHARFQSTLLLAIGDSHVQDRRANVMSVSAPTNSFLQKWQEFGIKVSGLGEEAGVTRLAIAESQTRVIGWKIPAGFQSAPRLPVDVSTEPMYKRDDIRVAAGAFKLRDTAVLEALCVSRGRSWIESDDRVNAIPLLESIKAVSEPKSLLASWSHYLLSLAALFSNKATLEMFSELKEDAAVPSLAMLFRAERMEFSRKLGQRPKAVEIANSLLDVMPPRLLDSAGDLDRYVVATTKFVLANLYREGGLYQDAFRNIDAAEEIYNPNISSHATELAHCHYAKTICVAITGLSNFDLHIGEQSRTNRRFASALINLAYAHAAWFVGDVVQAASYASAASEIFSEIDSPHYAKRARTLGWLLTAWTYQTDPSLPQSPMVGDELRLHVETLMGRRSDLLSTGAWLSVQRPSSVVGLLQFAREGKNWTSRVNIPVPPTLSWDANQKLVWRGPHEVTSLSELDRVLREHLAIPASRRIPLITD